MATKITSEMLESYLHCKFKGHLKLAGQQGTKCDFEAMLMELRAEVRLKAIDAIIARHPGDQVTRNIPLTTAGLRRGPQYVLDGTLEDDSLALHFDGLKRTEGESRLGGFHYLPVLFHEGRQIKKGQKLLLDVYGLVLSGLQGKTPAYGVIWHGPECKATRVKLNPDHRQAEQVLRGLKDMAVSASPPKLLLNEHCQVCEFRQRCRDQAVEQDNITLLRGMGEKEVNRYARKGVLTLTQLAHTFRPRRQSKRAVRRVSHRHRALEALAVRDKRIYVFGTPELPDSPVRLYLDIEGKPDENFVYLIGLLVVQNGSEERLSFWAHNKDQEKEMFGRFLAEVGQYDDFQMFCYGSYERTFLRRMRKAMKRKKPVDQVLSRLVNVLVLVHDHLYFPCYSNGLKDVATCLGCSWSESDASGIQSLVWRARWEATHDETWRQKLLSYNQEDCTALRKVTHLTGALSAPQPPEATAQTGGLIDAFPTVPIETVESQADFWKWGRVPYVHEDFAHINKCAYFDYQRAKVYVRTNKRLKQIRRAKARRKKCSQLRVHVRMQIRCSQCPYCKSRDLTKHSDAIHSKIAFGLRFTLTGISRQVVQHWSYMYHCLHCKRKFLPRKYHRRIKHLHSLQSWVIYHHVAHRISMRSLQAMLDNYLGLKLDYMDLHMFKALMATYYRPTYKQLLRYIVSGKLLHVDETEVKLRSGKGYVWVFTTMEEVVFIYRPTREGMFLANLLKGFTGVLVSDFYSVYDSLNCAQQKCLIHLMRDMNNDLLNSPFDEGYKELVGSFGKLLRSIVDTIDQYGLLKRHLNKHIREVDGFYEKLQSRTYMSEVASQYQDRLLKHRDKLFTFLHYDGIPWNNNNAEHAVKRFAHYRVLSDGNLTESGLNDYLVLLSIRETCRYKGVDFLKFLLSRERDINTFCEARGNTTRRDTVELYPQGFPCRYKSRARGEGKEMKEGKED